MLQMKIETLVNSLVRQLLVGQGREDEALYFQFDLSLAYYTNNRSYSTRRALHLLYYLPPKTTYVTAFSSVSRFMFAKVDKEVRALTWKHECTHDSCWAGISTFSDAYFSMAKEINMMLVEAGLPEVAPKDMSEHHNFPLFGQVFQWVPVKVTKDPTDTHRYRKLVEIL